nr:colicin E3/pyocin S6 family cytotoxin [Rouxiella aceris]
MTKPASTRKKPRKQHTPEFCIETLKLAERMDVAAAAQEVSLYESQLYAWRSKLKNAHSSSEREHLGSVDHKTGEQLKPAVKGRNIKRYL